MAQICLYDLSKPNLYRAIEKMFAGIDPYTIYNLVTVY